MVVFKTLPWIQLYKLALWVLDSNSSNCLLRPRTHKFNINYSILNITFVTVEY